MTLAANFEVPAGEKEKLLAERSAAQASAFADAPAPSSAPTGTLDPSALTAEQLQAAGEQWPGLEPAETRALLEGIFNPILEWADKDPLDEKEMERGGVALTPSLNKWAPYLLKNHAADIIALVWVAGVVKKRRKKPEKKKPEDEKKPDEAKEKKDAA